MAISSPIEAPAQARVQSATSAFRLPLDPLLTLAVLGLGICSVLTLKAPTASFVPGQPHYYVERQAIYLGIGMVAMVALSRLDYRLVRRFKWVMFALLMLGIFAVLAVGHQAEGAQRAIKFPLFSFQSSELGKVLLILSLSAFVAERSRELRSVATIARVLALALVPAVFVLLQPDLGSALVYAAITFMLLFVGGAPWRHVAGLLGLGVLAVVGVLVIAPAAGVHVLKAYQTERLTAFLHPTSNLQGIKEKEAKTGEPDPTYQQLESKIAIGSGQKTGRGSNATQTLGRFVPEDDTDFVFASVGEQYGFVGAALVLSLFALLIWRALRILTMAPDRYGTLIAGGVLAMLMFQVFVNVGMSIGIMPITGVTLPLMSYGGSSVMTTLLAVGLLQAIYVRGRGAEALKGRIFRY
ncbi:MAG: FtsW/RodA/SpoVE family cell cycle protein [Solirubrobacteraceae bacterium]